MAHYVHCGKAASEAHMKKPAPAGKQMSASLVFRATRYPDIKKVWNRVIYV